MSDQYDTEWFLDIEEDSVEGDETRRVTEIDGYRIEEEKIGSPLDPEYTQVRAFRGGELETAVVYEGDGDGLEVAEHVGEKLEEEGSEYKTPLSILNQDGSSVEDLCDERLDKPTAASGKSPF